ncbi:putative methyltransferase-domain-containing protein [Cubamyces lactineus]|nr:putative methyltransferase-domain-containing protein [Cubamyces lactineus]
MLPDPLFQVLRAYATLQPPKSIQLPVDLPFDVVHDFLLERILLNRHFQEYPPSKQYQGLFWKWAIDRLELLLSEEDEIDERIYTHHVDLMQDISSQNLGTCAPSASYVTYLWPSEHPVANCVYPGCANATLLESRTTIESGTTGLRTWSASLVLAEYLLFHPDLVISKTALELGCGAGFLGIIVATIQLAQAAESSLWLTDVNEPVLQRSENNLRMRANQSCQHPQLHFRTLDWFDAVAPDSRLLVDALFEDALPDVILGADVVYDPSIIPPLVQVLALALTPRTGNRQPVAYIALTQRNEETLTDFLQQAEAVLSVEQVCAKLVADNMFTSSTELGQSAAAQSVKIFRLKAIS